MSFAKIVVSGTLSSDPEKRFTPNNHTVTNFTLNVENPGGGGRGGQNEPFSVKITCWRNLAEVAATQLQKGTAVLVEGKLMMNSFQGQDGVQRKLFEIEANSIDKLPGAPEPLIASGSFDGSDAPAASRSTTPSPAAAAASSAPASGHFSSEDLLTEDDIPF